jgi:hypothetical protein
MPFDCCPPDPGWEPEPVAPAQASSAPVVPWLSIIVAGELAIFVLLAAAQVGMFDQ